MIDFFISTIVSLFVYVGIVAPYLDPIRKFLVDSGRMNEVEAAKVYYIFTFAVILAVGLFTYWVIAIVKYFLHK